MHHERTVVLALAVALLPCTFIAATQGAATPAEAYRALQKAAEARDVEAMAAVLTPYERDALRAEVARAGVETSAGLVPKGPLDIRSEGADVVAADADGRSILFVREESRWYVATMFSRTKKPIARVQPEPSVRLEGREVLTVAPVRGAGAPDEFAISATEAYELLREEARRLRPGARLYILDTGMHGLSPDGASSGWTAEFLTGTPGEFLRLRYDDGDFAPALAGTIDPSRKAVPDEETLSYDTRKLYEETVRHAAGVVDPSCWQLGDLVTLTLAANGLDLAREYTPHPPSAPSPLAGEKDLIESLLPS